jgi:hypothetical protein
MIRLLFDANPMWFTTAFKRSFRGKSFSLAPPCVFDAK